MRITITSALIEILLVQTYNGKVSITKDLTEHECKVIACRLDLQRTCMPAKCDDEGNLIYLLPGMQSCTGSVSDYTPNRIECLK
jgi:hypothetical protein